MKRRPKQKWKRFFPLVHRSSSAQTKDQWWKIYLNICSHFRFCSKNWSVNGCYLLSDDDDDEDYWWNRYIIIWARYAWHTCTPAHKSKWKSFIYCAMCIRKLAPKEYIKNALTAERHKLNAFLSSFFLAVASTTKYPLFTIQDFWQKI